MDYDLENIPLRYEGHEAFEKVASIDLSKNPENWDIEIIQHMHEMHPYLTGSDTEVVFKKLAARRGYGYGYIKIADVSVPVIIKDFEMSPMDVFMKHGSSYPLTKETISEVLHKTDMGKVEARSPRDSLDTLIYNRTYPPYDGKYVYASAKPYIIADREYKSMLANIDKSDEQLAEWTQKVASDKSMTANMVSKGLQDTLSLSLSNHRQKLAHSQTKEASLNPSRKVAAVVKESVGVNANTVEGFGKYAVSRGSGELAVGVVAPSVIDFDGNDKGYGLFMSEDGSLSSSMAKFAGVSIEGKASIKSGNPMPGHKIAFFTESEDGVQVYEPVKLASKANVDGVETYKVLRDFDSIVTVSMSDNVKVATKINDTSYVMPSSTKVAVLGQNINVLSCSDTIEKMARLTTGPRSIAIKSDGQIFSFHGDSVKEASLREGVSAGTAVEYMKRFYTTDSISGALKFAAKHGTATIQDHEDIKIVKTASNKITVSPIDLSKEAASLEDQGLVDTVLSLRFINDQNLDQYVGFIPQLEKAASHLADLLIGSRIGVNLEESPIKTAMEGVVKVVEDLRQLRGA
jgi:hypothetical protein